MLGDLSMILCDPYAINFLANSVIRLLQHLMNNEAMPRVTIFLIPFLSNQILATTRKLYVTNIPHMGHM